MYYTVICRLENHDEYSCLWFGPTSTLGEATSANDAATKAEAHLRETSEEDDEMDDYMFDVIYVLRTSAPPEIVCDPIGWVEELPHA